MDCKIAWNSNCNVNHLRCVERMRDNIPRYFPSTPIYRLDNLAACLGIHSLFVKDEGQRGGYGSFKCLGAFWAVDKLLASLKTLPGNFTIAAATDGNHGLGVAAATRQRNCRTIIRMPKGSSPKKVAAIRKLGAECTISEVNYDDTIAQLIAECEQMGWYLIQDTALPGYEEIPAWIMEGYGVIAHEIWTEYESCRIEEPTHIILQAGVGSFAAAIVKHLCVMFRKTRFLLVEPHNANCFYKSFLAGSPQVVTGPLHTLMAGLACGKPNPLAWPLLYSACCAAMSCGDWLASTAMRVLGSPLGNDPRILAGESGAVPLGGLLWLMLADDAKEARHRLSLNSDAKVLMINTEGPQNSEDFFDIMWGGAYPAPADFPWPGQRTNKL